MSSWYYQPLPAGAVSTPKQTGVDQVSLGWHGVPSEYTNHSLIIRARTTTGSTGTIRAALYEGANNRSGNLESSPLTTSLADYTLAIADASAATITDYSNLSVKFWGYDIGGNALVFEIAQITLQLPTSADVQPVSFIPSLFERTTPRRRMIQRI